MKIKDYLKSQKVAKGRLNDTISINLTRGQLLIIISHLQPQSYHTIDEFCKKGYGNYDDQYQRFHWNKENINRISIYGLTELLNSLIKE